MVAPAQIKGTMNFRQKIRAVKERVSRLPRPVRVVVGIAFVFFGLLGFLPILGFWMLPVGLGILAIDIPIVRKFIHRVMATFNQWRRKRRAK
jgi:asparagine N-glycosylation enzyme membrane subunit Stt3